MSNNEVSELKNILVDFVKEQKEFNKEQKQFNKEQKQFNKEQMQFNKGIDKKIDKVQYFLEETMAEHTKMFFEEQIELKSKVNDLNTEVFDLKNDLLDLARQFKLMQNS